MKFRSDPLFHQLLARNLSLDTQSAALSELLKAGPNYQEKLALYARLSDRALADEVGPPPSGIITWAPFYYTVWEVPKKLAQRRNTTALELFSAAADPIFLIVDVGSGGGTAAGRKALLFGTREAAEAAARKLPLTGGKELIVTVLQNKGRQLASKQIGKEVVEKMSEGELFGWLITGTLSEMQAAIRGAMHSPSTFDITRPVQFLFRYGNFDRKTFKRFSGLEPRLFMRGDAKVYVRFTNLAAAIGGSRTASFFEQTARDLTLGMAFESEPGQELIRQGAQQVISAEEQLRAWRKNVSAWWLLNASYDVPNSQPHSQDQ
jgi:hypothetical protein